MIIRDTSRRAPQLARRDVLECLVETTREGFWMVDDEGYSLDVNPAMCALLGCSRDAIIGKHIYAFVDDENRRVLAQHLRATATVGPYEVSLRRTDGRLVPCVNNATPVFDDAGGWIGSVGLWTDITGIKTAQRELELARIAAERANLAKSEFLASMSHELRTPLNAVLGFAQVLEANKQATLQPSQTRAVAQILRGGWHLLSLIDQVLDVARIETGRFELHVTAMRGSDLMDECVEMLRVLATSKQLQVSVTHIEDDLIQVDHLRARQVLLNLLSNAIKYNRVGGRVHIFSKAADAHLRIHVQDTGAGIPVARSGEVFDAFNRLGREHSEVEGTGVGLTLARHLVEAMGGAIGFDSDVGVGSMFWVDFPRAPAQTVAPPGTRVAEVPLDLRGTVLYVEANLSNVEVIQEMFATLPGLRLVSVADANTGLLMVGELQPDVILLDLNAPDLSGDEAAREFRNRSVAEATPVLALSAEASASARSDALGAGFDDYLAKPIDRTELLTTLARFLPTS